MAPFGLNIENNCLISYNGDSAIINIYLAFRSRQRSRLFCRIRFLDLLTIFIVIALRGMKAFPLSSWWRWVSVDGQFSQILGWETQWATRNFSLWRISARWNWVEKLLISTVFIYLFVYYLLIYYFFVCFLITLRELFVGSCMNYVA